jgi:hypothetical protein
LLLGSVYFQYQFSIGPVYSVTLASIQRYFIKFSWRKWQKRALLQVYRREILFFEFVGEVDINDYA